MSEKEVRKTTKKTVRKAAPKKATAKLATPKTNSKRKIASKVSTPVKRKAPTPVAATRATEKKSSAVIIVGVVLFIILIGSSAAVGLSGAGEIDIGDRISEIKEQATPEERSLIEAVPVQKTKLRDGGLVPSGVPEEVPVPKPVATSTESIASSTDLVATSAEELISVEGQLDSTDDAQESAEPEIIEDPQNATTTESL